MCEDCRCLNIGFWIVLQEQGGRSVIGTLRLDVRYWIMNLIQVSKVGIRSCHYMVGRSVMHVCRSFFRGNGWRVCHNFQSMMWRKCMQVLTSRLFENTLERICLGRKRNVMCSVIKVHKQDEINLHLNIIKKEKTSHINQCTLCSLNEVRSRVSCKPPQ